MFHMYIFFVYACLPLISASVYPIRPIQATVWSADQPMPVSWIEDWRYPVLGEMGPLDISLWCNTNTFLVQLASGVDPLTKARQVTVPVWALQQGSTYTLRFTTSRPIDVVVYSADFSIVPTNTTASGANANANTSVGAAASTTPSGNGAGTPVGSGFGTVPIEPDALSGGSATGMRTASARFGSTTPSGVPPPSGTLPLSWGGVSEGQRAASAGQRRVDVEKLKFRFVFVIWPVLMGISMAL